MPSEQRLPLAGRILGGFLDISFMYLRSPHGLVMEDHAVAIAIKALLKAGYLARHVHLFQRFSKPPPNSGFVGVFGD